MDKNYKPESDANFMAKMNEKCCEFNHSSDETCEQVAERVKELRKGVDLIKSGYAGVLSNGNIVDRREHKNAIPCQENPMFGTPKPKDV